jgi:hypothetical protein
MNEFYGIDVKNEGRVVQDWFDQLGIEAKSEILNLFLHLQRLPMGRWRRPEYDPLDGEGGISELRADEVSTDDGVAFYRIYGWKRYPESNSYTFLHGTDKDEKNDVVGKESAKRRATQLFGGEAHPHRFDFDR